MPPGVTGWVVKPVEIDDVPVVTLTLTSATSDEHDACAAWPRRSRSDWPACRTCRGRTSWAVSHAWCRCSWTRTAWRHTTFRPWKCSGPFKEPTSGRPPAISAASDQLIHVEAGQPFDERPAIARSGGRRVRRCARCSSRTSRASRTGRKKSPATSDTAGGRPAVSLTTSSSLALSWANLSATHASRSDDKSTQSAVTIAIAKKKGSNAVWVANAVLREAEDLRGKIVPGDMELIVTRNYGLTANEKVNELVEGLAVAILIVVALLTLGLGWREALIVAVAVPVVFGLTLAVNLMLGYTINRVTLFALILSLGLLVDDPIVDVENIARHFALRKKATRRIVLEAVAEIRPPLITATLAVIVSFLPMFFITGMMGPYMRPMALNVPVTMLMSMVVAFTITPWLAYHVLRRKYSAGAAGGHADHDPHDLDADQAIAALQGVLSADGAAAAFALGGLVIPAWHGAADRRGDGPGGHAQRAAEDAAVRQQERAAAGARLRQGHDAGTHGRRGPRLRGVSGQRPRGGRLHQLRRPGLADGLQRPGAALLSPPGRRRGRAADQPGGQEEPRSCRATPSACGCGTTCRRSPIGTRHA